MNQHQKTQLNIQRVNAYNLYKQRKAAENVARLAEQQHQQVAHQNRLLAKWQDRIAEQELLAQMTNEQKAEYLAEREQEEWENSFLGTIVMGIKSLFQIVFAIVGIVILLAIAYGVGMIVEYNWS